MTQPDQPMTSPTSPEQSEPPRSTPAQPSPAELVTRGLAAVMGSAVTVIWLLMVFIVVSPIFNPNRDPHGYALIAGSLLAVPLAVFAAITLPFALPKSRRRRGFTITVPIFAIGTALLFAVWFAAT